MHGHGFVFGCHSQLAITGQQGALLPLRRHQREKVIPAGTIVSSRQRFDPGMGLHHGIAIQFALSQAKSQQVMMLRFK